MGRETRNLASHSLRSGGEGPNPLSTSLLLTRGWVQAEPEKKGHPYPSPRRSVAVAHPLSLPGSLPDAVGVGAYRIFLNQEDKRGPSERQRKNKKGEREGEREAAPSGLGHTYAYVLRTTQIHGTSAAPRRGCPSPRGPRNLVRLAAGDAPRRIATRHSDGIHRTCNVLLLLLSFAAD